MKTVSIGCVVCLLLFCRTASGALCDDLMGYWRMEEGADTTAGDSSVCGVTGQLNQPSWTTGKLGGCVDFNAHVRVLVEDDGHFGTPRAFTIAYWLKGPTEYWRRYINKGDEWGFGQMNRMSFNFFGAGPGNSPEWIDKPVTAADNKWHLATAVVDHNRGKLAVYQDGVLVAAKSGGLTPQVKLRYPLRIVRPPIDIGGHAERRYFMHGQMDELAVWNRALSADEVKHLYHDGDGVIIEDFRATDPVVADGAVDVPLEGVALRWKDGSSKSGPITAHRIYFGTHPDRLALQKTVTASGGAPSFHTAELAPETTYYWRVDQVRESAGSADLAKGRVWRLESRRRRPVFTRQPVDLYCRPGQANAVVMTAAAENSAEGGGELGYQWFQDDRQIEGATGGTLTIGQPQSRHLGIYHCRATNRFGSRNSQRVKLSGPKDALTMWYGHPARNWMTEALPIGNGRLGGMIYGGVEQEHIQFNEDSLWKGGPGESAKLREGDWKVWNATDLAAFGSFQTFGDIHMDFDGHDVVVTDYRRELDLRQAVSRVTYWIGDAKYTRESFCSHPDQTMVVRLTCSKPGGLGFALKIDSPHEDSQVTADQNLLVLSGKVAGNNMQFEARLQVLPEGGTLRAEDESLRVQDADAVTLLLTAATDYLPEYPTYKGKDPIATNTKHLAAAAKKSYEQLRAAHVEDYTGLFDRVTLDLGESPNSILPTHRRLELYNTGVEDPQFEALYFQFGRYLLISSSRPGALPANLQGLWNNSTNPPWTCDYHVDINVAMNYWPAEITNLAECHVPLIELIDNLRPPGRETAKLVRNARGWAVGLTTNIWGYTDRAEWLGAGGWLCQHVWDHYAFSGDRDYLKQKAYPILKEASLFYLDNLSEHDDGTLISAKSFSPEQGPAGKGISADMQIIWELFGNCIEASKILAVDEEFREQLEKTRARLSPPKIGKHGQLQEWLEDLDSPHNRHRHISHLYALSPGWQIAALTTPKLADAAKKSLEMRGDGGTGWSLAWKLNCWARLGDGERAHKLLRMLLHLVKTTGTSYGAGGGTYENLFCAHPPFQIDGNFGGTSGIAEMLLQSQTGQIHLLPALPKAWPDGKVIGLRARNGFEVDVAWSAGELSRVTIRSKLGQPCRVRYGATLVEFDTEIGESYDLDGELKKI